MIRATKSHVIVEDLPEPFPGPIQLPVKTYFRSGRARVISVGPQVNKSLCANDRVLTKPLKGQFQQFVLDGKKYRVIKEEDVLGIVDYET